MNFTVKSINLLKPQVKTKRTTIKGTGIVVEQRVDLLVFHFKYKSPVKFKYLHIKLVKVDYGKITSKVLNAVKDKANILNAQVISGLCPQSEKKRQKDAINAKKNSKNTYPKLWDLYVNKERYSKLSDGTQKGYEIKFKKIKKHFRDRDINTITKFELDSFLESQTPSVRNMTRTLIIQLESLYRTTGISRDEKLDSIERAYDLPISALPVRDKVLSDDEIGELFKCDSTNALVLQWQLLNGCRVSEATGMKWKEINFQERTWTIPASRIKTEKKSSVKQKDHVLPLTNMTIEFLIKIKNRALDSLVFTNKATGKRVSTDRINVWLKNTKNWGFSSHACRRTVATRLAEVIPISEVKMILNHATDRTDSVTMGYINSQMLDKKARCLNTWHKELRIINVKHIQAESRNSSAG